MAIIEAIQKRYSCRAYKDKPIEQAKLDEIFEAARQAPSAKNLQDWRFVVVTDKETKLQVAQSTNRSEIFAKAGAIIAACSNSNHVMKCGQPVGPIDVAIAMEHIALQATHLGLATCWVGSFEPATVRSVLGIPKNIAVIELMAIGYPEKGSRQMDREPLGKIVCYEKWQF